MALQKVVLLVTEQEALDLQYILSDIEGDESDLAYIKRAITENRL